MKGSVFAFIGGGVMAEAMVSRSIASGVTTATGIRVGEPLAPRRSYLEQHYGVSAFEDNQEAATGAHLIVLSVKPQHLAQAMASLKSGLTPTQTVLSIVAGARMEAISRGLGHRRIIRVMPNTPAQVGAGMSVWTSAPQVPQRDRELARSLLKVLGEELHVQEEKYIDMATALSASGPAYVFLFLEALIDAGVYLGMPRDMAGQLALQTVLGSAQLARSTARHPAELRNMVTSPGGTTAEALLSLEEDGFRAAVINAVVAAYEKTLMLGEEH